MSSVKKLATFIFIFRTACFPVFFHTKLSSERKRWKLLAGTWQKFVLENRTKCRHIVNADVGFLFCMLVIYEKAHVVMRVNQCPVS